MMLPLPSWLTPFWLGLGRLGPLFVFLMVLTVLLFLANGAHAQTVEDWTRNLTGHSNNSWGMILNTLCYVVGTALVLFAVIGVIQHQRNPNHGAGKGALATMFVGGCAVLLFVSLVGVGTRSIGGNGADITGAQQQIQLTK